MMIKYASKKRTHPGRLAERLGELGPLEAPDAEVALLLLLRRRELAQVQGGDEAPAVWAGDLEKWGRGGCWLDDERTRRGEREIKKGGD